MPLTRRVGNHLYRVAFPAYKPLYTLYKAYADRAERKLLTRELPDGGIVVDAGANIGIYSCFLARCVGSSGMVHSFEPSPENFARLAQVTSKLSNIQRHQSAIGPETGEQTLYLSDALNVDHRLYPSNGRTRNGVTVNVVALDDYFPAGSRVDLIKADIQGYELHALRGAVRILEENPRIKLLLEFWPYGLRQAGVTPLDLISFLENKGFGIKAVFPSGLRTLNRDQDANTPDFYLNLFASRES